MHTGGAGVHQVGQAHPVVPICSEVGDAFLWQLALQPLQQLTVAIVDKEGEVSDNSKFIGCWVAELLGSNQHGDAQVLLCQAHAQVAVVHCTSLVHGLVVCYKPGG